jgi:hypothetical protein
VSGTKTAKRPSQRAANRSASPGNQNHFAKHRLPYHGSIQ